MNTLLRPMLALLALAAGACHEEVQAPEPLARKPREPEWFAALDGGGQQFLFVNQLRGYFASRGEDAEVDVDGRLRVTGRGPEQSYVVARLAEVLGKLPSAQWPELIAAHFEAMDALRDAVGNVEVPAWDEAEARLRLRIYPEEFLTGAGMQPTDVVTHVDLPGTYTVLVIDSESTALVVPHGELERWGKTFEQVMPIAFANTKKALEGALEVNTREFPDIGALRVVTGESFYTATAALWLGEFPETLGAHGAIVAVPWRNGVFVYPFEDKRIERVAPALFRYAQRIVEDSAGPIGTRIWWRRPDGSFAEIKMQETDHGLEVVPPHDLAALLQRME